MLFLTVVSLMFVPGRASAQTVDHPYRVEAVVTGATDPNPEDTHNLGVNRTAGRSGFDGFQIVGLIDCEGEVVEAVLDPVGGDEHIIEYETDDDVTDGFGEVDATDANRMLEGTGSEVRVPPSAGDPTPAAVRVSILDGRFHRILNVVEVDLTLQIRVVRNPGTTSEEVACESDAARRPSVRVTFLIVGPDATDGNGFQLVGEARRHGDVDGDRTSVARTVCGLVEPVSTRVTGTEKLGDGTPIGPGRGDFHPCPPEGQTN